MNPEQHEALLRDIEREQDERILRNAKRECLKIAIGAILIVGIGLLAIWLCLCATMSPCDYNTERHLHEKQK